MVGDRRLHRCASLTDVRKAEIFCGLQAGAAAEEAVAEMGDAHLTEQEKEEIANSSEFKEAADWLIAPSESLLLLGDSRCGLASTFSRPAYLPGHRPGLTFWTGISRLLLVSRCVCARRADITGGCVGIIHGVLCSARAGTPNAESGGHRARRLAAAGGR